MEQATGETMDAFSSTNGVDKPLPSLPPVNTAEKKVEIIPTTASPDSPSRPRMQSIQSFQRPKRKVPWKGKTCIIALPLTDRESNGLPPLLSSDEIKKRMQRWVAEGYDMDRLMSGGPQDSSDGFGQSRSLFPDPSDMYVERKNGQLHVHIPDQSEWDAWVDYLKEEKLRALGVTPSNSEAPMSVQSPFSSTLSRVSSTYPSVAASPPVGTFSANGNPVRIASNTFSPTLSHPGGVSSHGGSHVASPSISGYPGPMHGYKQSIAQPRLTSPYDYPVSHPGSFGPGMRNTPGGYGVRQFSPSTAANLQSLGQVLSPMIPMIPSNDNGHVIPQNPTMEQIRQQQQRQQQLHQHMMQHQRQYSYLPPPQSKSADQLPRTPVLESPQRHTPEIMHPTPRSHRHNLSAALQKGIEDAEAARDVKKPVLEDRKDETEIEAGAEAEAEAEAVQEPNAESVVEGEEEEEDQEPELPVLKRPETLADGDDKSDIETNPSIAASPLLMDNTNPFAAPFTNLQQIKNALQPQSQHQPKPSISKLNVDAPVFDPQTRFSSSNFSFGNESFQPTGPPAAKPLVAGSRPPFPSKNLSISKLNVDAPTFTPSFMAHSTPTKDLTSTQNTPARTLFDTPSKSSFTFSSPNFNVDAPEFKPGQSFSFGATSGSLPPEPRVLPSHEGSLFGNVTIDPNSKVTRRGAKIVPILRANSNEEKEAEQAFDYQGRAIAPPDRQKRARKIGTDDGDELLFASSAPFDHAEGLSSKKEETSVEHSDDVVQTSEVIEDIKSEPTDTELVTSEAQVDNEKISTAKEEPEQPLAEREVTPTAEDETAPEHETMEQVEDLDRRVPSPTSPIKEPVSAVSGDEAEAIAADATSLGEKAAPVESDLLQTVDDEPTAQSETDKPIVGNNHKQKFSLSALAKSFEFRPGQSFAPPATPEKQPETPPKPKSGLMASRFAAISPEPQPPSAMNSSNSPSHELYEYIKPEDARLGEPTSLQPSSRSRSPSIQLSSTQAEVGPQFVNNTEDSMRSEAYIRDISPSPSQSSRVDDPMPSYEEIDAVMKQFEDNPDLGVERDDTPVKSTPLIDMRLPTTFRSDAPSPSPRRRVISSQERADWGLGIHKLNDGNEEVSDWNHEFSPRQEDKLQSQAQYFDGRVNGLVDGILENRLVPLEDALNTIQQSLTTLLDKKQILGSRRSTSTENREASDADDEDDYEAFDGFSTYRSRSPSRNQRKAEKIRAIVMEAMAAYRPSPLEQPAIDMTEIHAALDEMRKLSLQAQRPLSPKQPDVRTVMAEVISNHPHFQSLKQQDDYEEVRKTYEMKLHALEASRQKVEERAEKEATLRQKSDEDVRELNRRLLEAQEKAMTHREAEKEAQSSILELLKEREAYHDLQSQHADVIKANAALEDTIAEYRVSSDRFRDEIGLERARNKDLIQRMHNLRQDFNDKLESRHALRNQMERLQDRMTQVMQDVRAEEDDWRRKEHEFVVQNKTIQAALDHEIRHREKLELELDGVDKEHKENMRFRAQYEQAQQEISRLQDQMNKMSEESKMQKDESFKLERELAFVRDSADGEVSKTTARLQSEFEAAQARIESLQFDSNAQISRLQKRLDDAELDLEDQKAKHDSAMSEAIDAHNQALHEVNQKRENALEEQHTSHERKLNDLRDRHTRALHNSTDDRHRLEHQMNEKLAINEDRVRHLESQVKDLEERLEVSKSAARAAVEAATAKAVASIPTPAPSVMASPPQRLSGASLQLMKGSDIPEKISPQAMRESIMVLQDQLQNREQTIEQLEGEIAALDKDAPAKIKERDNEITLLRELLTVRVDDLDEIIATLAQPSFDREATKNAAIRLKANLQMEQQLKERAAASGGLTSALPSISTLSSYAQSPRGLPMAAAAAWGNWRKARDYGMNAVSDIASNISQTPSKSNPGSPSGFLAGIMTPPSTSQRTPPPSDKNPLSPPTMRPLAAAAAARKSGGIVSEARPLRTYSSQARTLSSKQVEMRRESADNTSPETGRRPTQPLPETPTTPLASRSIGTLDLGEDVDEDASPYTGSDHENIDSEITPLDSMTA